MKQTIGLYEFRKAFADHNRQNQFSYEGLELLFDYFEEYEESCGVEVEFDVIAICCDFTEYDSAMEACEEYGLHYYDKSDELDEEDKKDLAVDCLAESTTVITLDEGVIIQNF